MFLWRNKKTLNTFWLKKKSPYQELCLVPFNTDNSHSKHRFEMTGNNSIVKRLKAVCTLKFGGAYCFLIVHQGPVFQSIVSLTSSLRVISLTILADSIYNILIFFAEKM